MRLWSEKLISPHGYLASKTVISRIDIGSNHSKAPWWMQKLSIQGYWVGPTGAEHRRRANKVMEDCCRSGVSLDEIA